MYEFLSVFLFVLGLVYFVFCQGSCTYAGLTSLVFLRSFVGCSVMYFPRYWLAVCVSDISDS
jgi:hypothetical protein